MGNRHKSRLTNGTKTMETLAFSDNGLGQHRPQHCPQSEDALLLGEPMTIRDVAALLGCSPWTVRQKYVPQGLPYLRASRAGKLVFFRNQVVDWILRHQSQGSLT